MNFPDEQSRNRTPVTLKWHLNWKVLAFALIFLPLTVSLGFWQLHRAEEKSALLAEYQRRENAPPVPLASLSFNESQQYRRVTGSGKFVEGRDILLENRIRHGQPGFEVLSLFSASNGNLFWVDRGWLAGSLDRSDLPTIPSMEGTVTLTGHLYRQLKAPFTVGEEIWREEWPQVLQNYSEELLERRLGLSFAPYRLRLDAVSPGALSVEWQIVNVIPEKHTGYAVQWFLMALALVILTLFANSNLAAMLKRRNN